jgi:excisionase family DNA binding protein
MPRLLTIDEVAHFLRVPSSRARALVRDGDLLAFKLGRTTLIPSAEVSRFVGGELDAAQRALEV